MRGGDPAPPGSALKASSGQEDKPAKKCYPGAAIGKNLAGKDAS
jgi:hypothetical protein